jgi:tRNA(fMet)-specific endonuclease VapC
LETVLGALDAPPFEAPADVTYGRLRSQLEKAGQSIGANDLLIAAQTLTSGYTLVSDNEREFSRVDDLPLENWIR